jgi:hypothetical protein
VSLFPCAAPHFLRCPWRLTITGLLLAIASPAVRAEPAAASVPALGAGATFPTLQAGAVTYHDVRVRSVTVRSLVIVHRDGMASVRLRELSPDLQQAFGYSPAAEAAADAAAKTAAAAPKPAVPARPRTMSPFEQLLQQFSRPPELRPEVDLRPKFVELALYAKDQGRRPSCSVFAVVSALEFQNAQLVGHAEKLSEEYLIWATRKILGRDHPAPAPAGEETPAALTGDEDEGFALTDVVTAVRTYGIPPAERMPDTLGKKMQDIAAPPDALIEEARRHCRVAVYRVPGRDPADVIGNFVHTLNAGLPVVVGMRWPHSNAIRSGYLSNQQPMSDAGHAVTLVGYHAPTASLDDVVFIFKNSWGVQWGAAGYGQVTARYLARNLNASAVLEVQRSPE